MYLNELQRYLQQNQFKITREKSTNLDYEYIYNAQNKLVAKVDEGILGHVELLEPMPTPVAQHILLYAQQQLSQRFATQEVVLKMPKHDFEVLRKMTLKFSNPNGLNELTLSIDEVCMLHHLQRVMRQVRKDDVIDN